MARKTVKAAMFHGEIVAVEGTAVSVEGRALGKPDKGLAQVKPKPEYTVPFGVTDTTFIEVDGVTAGLDALVPGQHGVVKATGSVETGYIAILLSFSTDEEEIEEPEVPEAPTV